MSRGSSALDSSNPPFYKWFPGWQMNTCFNAVDRHVANGSGSKVAIIYDSPVTNTVLKITYSELLDKVSHAAGALQSIGVGKGDRVMIYMPMIPEAIVSMLACARLGAVHSVVFGGFAPHELSVRIDDLHPKVILSASCGIETSTVIEYASPFPKLFFFVTSYTCTCPCCRRALISLHTNPVTSLLFSATPSVLRCR